ncbi:DUF4402 domain-containing protein [Sphingomonas sp.]|uniref:DUF4402 domain-containing protein n=1 Tax=Sphingomonas sp. TaxID=28214 RepID=UPI0038A9DFA8
MGRLRSLAFSLAAACAAGIPSPGMAQCRLCTQPSTQLAADSVDGDVELRVETNLDFDRLIFSGVGLGAALLRPDGSSAAEGIVSAVGPRATVGTVLVHGEAGRALRVELPHRIELYSMNGARMTLEQVTTDLPAAPRLDSAGNLSFRFGGRLVVTGDGDGQYRGDLPITVEYL